MEGSPWLIDRCTVLLENLSEGADPDTFEINTMRIIVRLYNVPFASRTPKVAKQLGNAIGSFLNLVPPRRDDLVTYLRVKLKLVVLTAIKRGILLRVGGGRKFGCRSLMSAYHFSVFYVGLSDTSRRNALYVSMTKLWIPGKTFHMAIG